MRWVVGYAAALCVLALILCESVFVPAFLPYFYHYEFDKRGIPESIRVEKDELMYVTGELLDYMRGRRDDLVVSAVVGGETREFFNQREKDHMVDVRILFEIGYRIRNTAFWALLLAVLIMAAMKVRIPYVLARCCREVLTAFLILSIVLIVVIALDFNRAFNTFHDLFFNNDLWVLDPSTDLLINIVPLGFFMDITLFIAVMIVSVSLFIITCTTIYLQRVSDRERCPECY